MSKRFGLFFRLAVMIPVFAGLNLPPTDFAYAQTQKAQRAPSKKPAFGPRARNSGQGGTPAETIATFEDWKVQCETPGARKKSAPDKSAPDKSAPGAATEEGAANKSGKSDSEAAAPEVEQPEAAEPPAVEQPEAADASKRVCGMTQTTRSEKVPQIGLSLFIARARQGDKTQTQMRLLAPIGVYLPTGVALEIDGSPISRVPFSRCLPQFCVAIAEASPETLDKMVKGEAANFIVYQGPGAGLPMKISLKGFGKALEKLDSQ